MRHDQLLTQGFDDFKRTWFNKWKTIGALEAFRTRHHGVVTPMKLGLSIAKRFQGVKRKIQYIE